MPINQIQLLRTAFVLYITIFWILVALYEHHVSGPKIIHNEFREHLGQSKEQLNAEEMEEKFEKIKAEYQRHLARRSRPKFQDSTAFVDIDAQTGSLNNQANKTIHSGGKPKLVLLWTVLFHRELWMPETLCMLKEHRCIVTTNKADLLASDAVVMNSYHIGELPRERLPNQRWVYFSREPPHIVASKMSLEKYNGVFNWTATYRRDSDFPAIFLGKKKRKQELSHEDYEKEINSIMAMKSRLVAIANSNCKTKSPRQEYVEQLRRYVPVDFYGFCGNLTCERFSRECDRTMSTYKFYLSFENSQCRDYISEKAYNPLYIWKSVPIVMGALEQDYRRVMPPFSFINTDGFRSAQKLAEYIRLLDENQDLYKKYHAWRKSYVHNRRTFLCDMCSALHNPSMPVKVYRNFSGWYHEDICSFP